MLFANPFAIRKAGRPRREAPGVMSRMRGRAAWFPCVRLSASLPYITQENPLPPRGGSNFPYIRARRGGGGPAPPCGLTPAVPYAGLWGLMHFLCTFYALSALILLYLQIMHKKNSFFETPIICIILLIQ